MRCLRFSHKLFSSFLFFSLLFFFLLHPELPSHPTPCLSHSTLLWPSPSSTLSSRRAPTLPGKSLAKPESKHKRFITVNNCMGDWNHKNNYVARLAFPTLRKSEESDATHGLFTVDTRGIPVLAMVFHPQHCEWIVFASPSSRQSTGERTTYTRRTGTLET